MVHPKKGRLAVVGKSCDMKRRSGPPAILRSAIESLEPRQLLATAYIEQGGLFVVEAETNDGSVTRSGATWTAVTSPAGFAGTGAMSALPNSGIGIDTSIATTSPELKYNVTVSTPGVYNIYIRAQASTGNDDTIHIGLDGAIQGTSTAIVIPQASTYSWGSTTIASGTAKINIATTGTHVISLYMREDGAIVDRMVFSTTALTPSGVGPAVSSRGNAVAQTVPSPTSYPTENFDLTSLDVTTSTATRASYLDRVEGIVRAMARYQDSSGAIIDPFEGREVQYSTPYFAYCVAYLNSVGRGTQFLQAGINAMNRATQAYAGGRSTIPDQHGEFFIAPLASAYALLKTRVSSTVANTWLTRLQTPLSQVLSGYEWNWRTYAMKGVWLLYKAGAMSKSSATSFIESSWTGSQKARLTTSNWNLYLDGTGDPDTLAYDAASRGNLLSMITNGYDGASASAIKTALLRGTEAALYLVDPTGQAPSIGRSGNHVWNDIVASLAFERAATLEVGLGNTALAKQFRHASIQGVLSADRWKRKDGLYQVTKNRFGPEQRVGYADYSFLTNYNGYMMYHLTELYAERASEIGEASTPAEIGGYVKETDSQFSSISANAGGLQLEGALRGQTKINYGQFWTHTGIDRISQVGWDSRLGTLGGRDAGTGLAVTFAPTFFENGTWKRMAQEQSRYQATLTAQAATPSLVKFSIIYAPKSGQSGATFTQNITITPDGVLSSTTSNSSGAFGMSLPLLSSDGAALATAISTRMAAAAFPGTNDAMSYLALDSTGQINTAGAAIRTATGDLLPLRLTNTAGGAVNVFLYPSTLGDPKASKVLASYTIMPAGFRTTLGGVNGNVYAGRTCAGGYGNTVDLDSNGTVDMIFADVNTFIIKMIAGKLTAVQSDKNTVLSFARKTYGLTATAIRNF